MLTAGQVLVKLDDRDYKVKLEQALAAQKGASAGVGVSQDHRFIPLLQLTRLLLRAGVVSAGAKLDQVS